MGVLSDASWCFCNGGGKSERMKVSIFSSKASAMARVSSGTGFLIHKNLLLTTHISLPSATAAEEAEIQLQDPVSAKLVPHSFKKCVNKLQHEQNCLSCGPKCIINPTDHRFFITSSVLDLTIVGFDGMDGETNAQYQQPHYLKTRSNPTLDLGSIVYLLGHTEKKELTVGEGKVVIATDNLIKLSTNGITWSPGSAGFDVQGNLAFMVCDPMKLASSPSAKSSSTSSSSSLSWKKDQAMQFGIPIPIICEWLNKHWEGNLDDLNKPKLPLIRLMSTGQRSEHSCASFTLRRVFKSTEDGVQEGTPSSSHIISRPTHIYEEQTNMKATSHDQQGIPTPEIYESPRLTSVPIQKKEIPHIQLLDINFPPRVPKTQPIKSVHPKPTENIVKKENLIEDVEADDAEIASNGSVYGDNHSEVQSCSSPVKGDGYSSEGETMYSASTMESRNYSSPREDKFQQVGRSQSCVSYNRRGVGSTPIARKAVLQKQQSFIQTKKTSYSQGGSSQKSHDFYSPTVSSIMKKRTNSLEQRMNRPRQSPVHLSPRWT
ncbi:hypothetical protein GIB67_028970 [Kingdonia uniflora]|uniref:Uncharacterized protein n=1 Tax=Kingdonia uniflora TaxID=39325 RepID=A0A7J7LCB3_9MAGN|nr:hypothetical protein GIB67_028970 [Kingdonia uniflora]